MSAPKKLFLVKKGANLAPYSQDDFEALSKIKEGACIKVSYSVSRNPGFHKKFFALLRHGYDHWQPIPISSKWPGVEIKKDFDSFREDVTILAGYFDSFQRLDGTERLKAKSIAFDSMSQEAFEVLFSKVVDVLLTRVLTNYTKDDLQKVVDEILKFT